MYVVLNMRQKDLETKYVSVSSLFFFQPSPTVSKHSHPFEVKHPDKAPNYTLTRTLLDQSTTIILCITYLLEQSFKLELYCIRELNTHHTRTLLDQSTNQHKHKSSHATALSQITDLISVAAIQVIITLVISDYLLLSDQQSTIT